MEDQEPEAESASRGVATRELRCLHVETDTFQIKVTQTFTSMKQEGGL